MVISDEAATLKLMRDYQKNGEHIDGLANIVHSKGTAIRKLLDLLDSKPDQVRIEENGFRVPPKWTVDPEATEYIALDDVSVASLHEALREMAMAVEDAKRLEGCLNTAGLPGYGRASSKIIPVVSDDHERSRGARY